MNVFPENSNIRNLSHANDGLWSLGLGFMFQLVHDNAPDFLFKTYLIYAL